MSNRKQIDKAKTELADFKDTLNKVWDEDFTPEMEAVCLIFYKAGLNLSASYISELKKKLEIAVEALEREIEFNCISCSSVYPSGEHCIPYDCDISKDREILSQIKGD